MGNRSRLLIDDTDELGEIPAVRNMPRQKTYCVGSKPSKKHRNAPQDKRALVAQQTGDPDVFTFSYKASRHERGWITDSLSGFYDLHWIDDVLRLVKGGKEANVYLCQASVTVQGLEQPLMAAKVYRPRRFRNLKNDHIYREGRANIDGDGREIIDDGMLHAIHKKTAFGLELLHTSWIEHEVRTIETLLEAGCDVPNIFASGGNAILMTYYGDEDMPAPTLNSVALEADEARELLSRVLRNVELMLANQRIHGDLSAYNILYWDGQISLIDFPQAIDPDINSNAYRIFERDLIRVCEYFTQQGAPAQPRKLAAELWTAYGRRLAPDVHPRLLDDQDETDRAYWESIKNAQ